MATYEFSIRFSKLRTSVGLIFVYPLIDVWTRKQALCTLTLDRSVMSEPAVNPLSALNTARKRTVAPRSTASTAGIAAVALVAFFSWIFWNPYMVRMEL